MESADCRVGLSDLVFPKKILVLVQIGSDCRHPGSSEFVGQIITKTNVNYPLYWMDLTIGMSLWTCQSNPRFAHDYSGVTDCTELEFYIMNYSVFFLNQNRTDSVFCLSVMVELMTRKFSGIELYGLFFHSYPVMPVCKEVYLCKLLKNDLLLGKITVWLSSATTSVN